MVFGYLKDFSKKYGGRILQFYRNLSIRLKLLVILNIAILVPLILISVISYKYSENVIKNKSIQYSQDLLKTIELRLNDNVLNLNMISQNMMTDERIYSKIDNTPKDLLTNYEDDYEIGNVLKNTILSVSEIQSACLISRQGEYYYADNSKTKNSIKEIVPPGSSLLEDVKEKARKEHGSPVWVPVVKDNSVGSVLYARTIYDRDTYSEIGTMIILINSEYFNSVFQILENKDMSNVAVISADNRVIFSKQKTLQYTLKPNMFRLMNGDGWMIDKTGGLLISYTTMGTPPWKVVSFVPLSSLYRDIRNIRENMIFTCLITVLIMSFVSFGMAYDFIGSINRLVSGMKRVQDGEEGVKIELNRRDEIGYMGDAFNNMVREISMLENWVYREQLTRKEAELKSLQAQINPHFLFNTLESINWMAQLENVPQISKTVTALASLMEASIVRGDKFIPLRSELAYIDNYMLIMKNRFEDRLELIRRIEPEALDITIPRLLVQPLVENAVLHGIGNSRGKGIVIITAKTNDGVLELSIEDNGAGIPRNKLEEIRRRLDRNDEAYYDGLENGHSGGIGLENVNRRIKLFYGEEYQLGIESEEGHFTRVLIRIPTQVGQPK